MKLYYSKGACSFAVRVIIHEIGIDCEFEAVDLKAKKTASGSDFLAINPKGYVPVLQFDDGSVLTENSAIQQYLAETYQATNLLPGIGQLQRYRVLEWLNYVSTELHKTAGLLFQPTIPQDLKTQFFSPALERKLDFVNQQLEKGGYITGSSFTLADAYLMVILKWLPLFNIELSKWSNINSYFHLLMQRPAIQRSIEEEK